MALPRVFIVQPVPDEALRDLREMARIDMFDRLDRPISRTELLQASHGCNYLWAFGEIPVDGEVMDAGRLRLIGVMEIVSRAVDIRAATARCIPVTTLPNLDAITVSTAEHTLALLLALARRIPGAERSLREGRWTQYQSMGMLGIRLAGKTLGIIGLGRVGQRVATYATALGMTVLYTDRTRLAEAEAVTGASWRDLDDLLAEADVVAICATLTASSDGLIDAARLRRMRPGALLVNTARGRVIDEAALVEALRERRLAGAALDVFSAEPPTPGGGPLPELLKLDNVVLSPHQGTATSETRLEMARTVAAGIIDAIQGRRPAHVVNPEVYGEAVTHGASDRLA